MGIYKLKVYSAYGDIVVAGSKRQAAKILNKHYKEKRRAIGASSEKYDSSDLTRLPGIYSTGFPKVVVVY